MLATSWMLYVASAHMLRLSKQDGNIRARAIQWNFVLDAVHRNRSDAFFRARYFLFRHFKKKNGSWINKRYTRSAATATSSPFNRIVRCSTHAFAAYSFICVSVARVCRRTLSSTSQDITKLYLYTQYTESNE